MLRLLVLAFLCNAVAPVLASQADAENRVLLCTSQGYQWVTLDQDSTETTSSGERCVFCLATDDDDADFIDQSVSAATLLATNNTQALSHSDQSFAHSPEFFSLSRAPPALHNRHI